MALSVRVTAIHAGVGYYPAFLARSLGYFEHEGLTVTTVVPGHGPWVARALAAGEADIALGGIWRPLAYKGRLETFRVFAQLCIRAPWVILGRDPERSFAWNDLEGREVLVPAGAPSPWMLLSAVLRRAGVSIPKIRLIQDFHPEEATALFVAGLGDYYMAQPPASDALIAKGFVEATTLAAAGPIPWSVYYSTPEFLEKDDRAERFTRAIGRALTWLLEHDPEEVPEVMDQHFPALPRELIAQSVRAARERGVWTGSPAVDELALGRWQDYIVEYGLITGPVAFDEIVDRRPAAAAR